MKKRTSKEKKDSQRQFAYNNCKDRGEDMTNWEWGPDKREREAKEESLRILGLFKTFKKYSAN